MSAAPQSARQPGNAFSTRSTPFSSRKPWKKRGARPGRLHHDRGSTHDAASIARRVKCSKRGVRILCDYLTVKGFLTKSGGSYGLEQDSAVFLNRNSGLHGKCRQGFASDTSSCSSSQDPPTPFARVAAPFTIPSSPIWVTFPRHMMPSCACPPETALAKEAPAHKVLDIANGHGIYGIAVARHSPDAPGASGPTGRFEVATENAPRPESLTAITSFPAAPWIPPSVKATTSRSLRTSSTTSIATPAPRAARCTHRSFPVAPPCSSSFQTRSRVSPPLAAPSASSCWHPPSAETPLHLCRAGLHGAGSRLLPRDPLRRDAPGNIGQLVLAYK